MMDLAARRRTYNLVRAGLIAATIAIVAIYFVMRRSPMHRTSMRLESEAPAPVALAAGDMQIVSDDGSVELVLMGDRILAGLSPKTQANVRSELEKSSAKDTAGLGGSIAAMVKKTVAGAIGTHMAYPLSDIREIRYEGGRMVIVSNDGHENKLFGNTKVNGRELSNSFRPEDVQRFTEAVRARQAALRRR
jgi:hypothetical protein